MKSHTSEFKEEIKTLGKQQSVRITYTLNDEQIILTNEDINSATPNYEASLLKSVMKGLDIDSNIDIPLGTEIKFEYGLLINKEYEYLNYGNYIVYSSEKQEDTLSYKITCYDKMLYSMKDYEHIDITYPCTIKQYLIALCNKIGLQFKDSNFANANRQITSELFMTINEDGTYSSMGYTYRDVLDQIAETTGGCICITLDDKVEVRYVNKTINYEQSEKSNIIQFKTEVEEPIILERLEGKSIQATRSGKNLLNLLKCSFSRCTLNSDNKSLTCSINNYYYASVKTTELNNWLLQNKGKKITFSTGTTLEGKNTGIIIYGTRSDGSTYQEANETGTGKCSITIADDFTAITSIELRFNRQSTTFTDTTTVINYAMLELGAVATDYEEYGVMPSPDYPSEIENIEGNIEFKVEGKNKLNGNKPDGANYATASLDNDVITIHSTATNTTPFVRYEFPISSGDIIRLNAIILDTNGLIVAQVYNGTSWLTSLIRNYIDGSSLSSITYESTEGYTAIRFLFYANKEIPTAETSSRYKNVIVTLNNEDMNYEPYKSQVVTFPLGEEKLMNGSYLADDGIHHTRKQVVLDGTEDWRASSIYHGSFYIYSGFSSKFYGCKAYGEIVCTNFIRANINSSSQIASNYTQGTCFLENSNGTANFWFDNGTISLADFRTWLSTHPVTVEYELAEPETVPYTAEQKTILTSIKTMKGTNIFEFPSDTIISYPINYDTIDEEYINNTNVSFGEKYGAINSIVLARAGESDKIYKKDQNSIELNGLCELMISENQFMNFNDRVDYLQELSEKLFGVEYYLNDFVSTGIMYYDLLDMYNVEIFGKTYNCLMLNDEQNITQGLEENIHTDRPETSETDYKKADTTDRKINQTYLIVDKQNKKIEGVINQIGDRTDKTTTITADIDGLNSKVSTIADLTNETSGTQIVTLENCAEGEVVELHIYGNNTVFKYQYLSDDLYLSDNLLLGKDKSIIIIADENGNKTYFDLGIEEVLRQRGDTRDEYILKNGQAQIIRRINKDGTIKDNEATEDLGEFHILLPKGNNTLEIKDFSANIYVKWAVQNEYTDTFATKVQLNTSITQTSTQIMTEVNKKVDEKEFGTKIEQNSEAVKLAWNQISEYIQMMIINGNASFAILDKNKKILTALDKTGQHFYNNDQTMDIGAFDCYFPSYDNIYKSLMFALNEKSTNNFMAWGYKTTSENGETTYIPVIYLGGNSDDDYGFHIENDIILNFNKIRLKKSKIYDNNDSLCFEIGEDLFYGDTRDNKEIFSVYNNSNGTKTFRIFGDDSNPIMIDSSGNFVLASGKIILDNNGNIDCVHLYQTGDSSDIRIKSNIKDSSESAIDIINKIHHKEFDKKDDNTHYKIGYIAQEMEQIDKNFVIKKQANKEKGIEERYYINQLPILATATKAIQEQQKQIEELKKEIEKLKGEKNG